MSILYTYASVKVQTKPDIGNLPKDHNSLEDVNLKLKNDIFGNVKPLHSQDYQQIAIIFLYILNYAQN